MKRTIRVVAAIIERGGRYLITQRRPSAVLPLLWEFPGGRVEVGESDQDALKREVFHRVGVDIQPRGLSSFVSHEYPRYVLDLYLYECEVVDGEPRALAVNDFRWVESTDLDQFSFTPADEVSLDQLLGES